MPMSNNPLTNIPIVGHWPRSRGGSRNGVNEGQCSDLSSPRMIRTRSRLGSKTLSGSSRSSTYVQPILPGTRALSTPFQTQLGIATHMAVADTQTRVIDTQTVVVDSRAIAVDTQTMVADMHRRVLTGQAGTSCQNHSVGVACHP